jgi:TetR/AcrR family transcriptional regulator, mexJK operon transcriptional repressor
MNARRTAASLNAADPASETAPWTANPKAGRPTGDELERRKQKIMQVATALFVKNGYAATSLVDIAKSAGAATRTLYQHFGDKEALFRQVMFARDTAAVLPPPQIQAGESLFDIVSKTANYVLEVSLRPTTVDLMRLTIAESARFPELTKKLTDATYSRFRANVKGVFDELAQSGLVTDDDTALSAAMFVDLVLGTTPLLVYAGWQSPPPRYSQLNQKLELFIRGRFGASAEAGLKARRAPRLSRIGAADPAADSIPSRSKAVKPRRAAG